MSLKSGGAWTIVSEMEGFHLGTITLYIIKKSKSLTRILFWVSFISIKIRTLIEKLRRDCAVYLITQYQTNVMGELIYNSIIISTIIITVFSFWFPVLYARLRQFLLFMILVTNTNQIFILQCLLVPRKQSPIDFHLGTCLGVPNRRYAHGAMDKNLVGPTLSI